MLPARRIQGSLRLEWRGKYVGHRTVMRDLLTNTMAVWQVVFDECFCVVIFRHLDVWDPGEDGDADIEAARIVEDDDESEDGDDDDDEDDDENEDDMDDIGINEDEDDIDGEDILMTDAISSTGGRRIDYSSRSRRFGKNWALSRDRSRMACGQPVLESQARHHPVNIRIRILMSMLLHALHKTPRLTLFSPILSKSGSTLVET